MSSLSDENLIKSCLAGNKQHAKLLYERYARYVFSLSYNFVKDYGIACDLTQDVFEKTFKKLKTYREEAKFKTWLTNIIVNHCKDYVSKLEQRMRPFHESVHDTIDGATHDLADSYFGRNPSGEVLRNEKREIVDDALDSLSHEHKTVILLWNDGFSYDEISFITETPKGTVGSRISEARKQLKELLAPLRVR